MPLTPNALDLRAPAVHYFCPLTPFAGWAANVGDIVFPDPGREDDLPKVRDRTARVKKCGPAFEAIMRIISADDMQQGLTFDALIDALDEAHRQPMPKMGDTLLNTGNADYLVRSAWMPGRMLGSKMVTVFPDNPTNGSLPSVQGVYALFDGIDGSATAIIDGTALTYWKTAADSALGARYLARSEPETLLMVGAGALAPWLVRAHLSVRPSLSRVLIWNRSADRASSLARTLNDEGIPARQTGDLESAARSADLITCATLSRSPLIRGTWLQPGSHLDLVGSYLPEMREADDEAMARARVFVDCRATTLELVGDLIEPIRSGAITTDGILGDLYDLAQGCPARTTQSQITVYKNAGGAHLDLITAQAVVQLLD